MKLYNCSKCGETNPEKFYKGTKSKCKACKIKEAVIVHRLNPEYQRKQAEFYKEWYAKNGRKRADNYQDIIVLWNAKHQSEIKVGRKVAKAIRQGLLERPLWCVICGRSQCRINAHHNDYDFPYDIMWLCSSCHKKIHQQSTT